MKNKKIIIIGSLVFVILIFIFFMIFYLDTAKNFKIGNNITSQELVDKILKINSYEATIEVDIKSNKNENKYVIKQKYNGTNENSQEVLEPTNIAGVKITKKENTLTIENTNLNLVSMFENYQYLSSNQLDLNTFIEDYKNDDKSSYGETRGELVMRTTNEQKLIKSLYINKETRKPVKMEIEDANKKTAVYILYREASVNS